jgi:hypothetical protein
MSLNIKDISISLKNLTRFKKNYDAYIKSVFSNNVAGDNTNRYVQTTKLGSKAGQSFDLSVDITFDFNRPPVEVLKFKQGSAEVQTKNTFDNSEASDFVVNGQGAVNNEFDYISLDGTIHPKVNYGVAIDTQSKVGDNYITEFDEIDFNDYRNIASVVV